MKFRVLSGEEAIFVPRPPLKSGRVVLSENAILFATINNLMDTAELARAIQEAYRRLPARVKEDIKAERLKRNALTLATRRTQ